MGTGQNRRTLLFTPELMVKMDIHVPKSSAMGFDPSPCVPKKWHSVNHPIGICPVQNRVRTNPAFF